MKAISNEGGGGDNLAVAAYLPDGTVLEPIPVTRLAGHGDSPAVEYLLRGIDMSYESFNLPLFLGL